MTYDDAWDMPLVNWQQQGSFEIPEIPPVTDPDEEPLVCLPPINRYWLPYVVGALDQMRNPSSWLVASDDAMYACLSRVSKLREMIGVGEPCMTFMIRFDVGSCQLQQSVDGGTTWTEVDGWSDWLSCVPPQTLLSFDSGCTLSESFDGGETYGAVPGWIDNFSQCVRKYMPIIGLPPNPGDEPADQFACSIADYLAEHIILDAMNAAVVGIQDNLTLLAIGGNILNVIPEFVLVRLGYDAISIIYTAIAEGTLSDYESALTDGGLWGQVKCAIYAAIVGDGYVTPGNFAAIESGVAGISYAHSDVISAIGDYISSLGATGLAQLSQGAGLQTGADCDSCGGWCWIEDYLASSGAYSSAYLSRAVWTSAGWTGTYQAGNVPPSTEASVEVNMPASGFVTSIDVQLYSNAARGGGDIRLVWYLAGTQINSSTFPGGPFPDHTYIHVGVGATIDKVIFVYRVAGTPVINTVESMQFNGTGTNPFPSSNC